MRRLHGLAGRTLCVTAVALGASRALGQNAAPPAPPDAGAPSAAAAAPAAQSARETARANAEAALRRTLLPQPMDAKRLEALVASVDPALATNAQVREAFARYTAVHERVAVEPGRRILQLAPAAYVFDAARESFEPRATTELVALLELREKAMRDALDAEKDLMRALESETPGERRPQLALSRMAWAGDRLPREGLLPTTTLSLADFVVRLRLPDESLPAVEPVMRRYAELAGSQLAARAQLLRWADGQRARVETEAGTLWRYAAPELVSATEELLEKVADAEFASELALRDLHANTLRDLRSRLLPQDGRRLVENWQRAVHPELFDDERMLATVLEEVLAQPSVDSERNRAILEVAEAGFARIEPMARASCEAADLVLPRLASRDAAGVAAEIEARIALLGAQLKRRAAVSDTIQRIRGMLGPDESALLPKFDDLRASIDALDRADRFDLAALAERLAGVVERGALAPDAAIPAGSVDSSAPAIPSSAPSGAEAPAASPSEPAAPRDRRPARGSRRGSNP
ncbi:MAG: hypothetical protein ACKOYN_06510 [Planctomycetota bacterium]